VALCAVLVPLSADAQSQLTSPNFQLDVNGVGEAGVGNVDSTNFGVNSDPGPVFALSTTTATTSTSTPPSTGGGGRGGGGDDDDDEEEENNEGENESEEGGEEEPPVTPPVTLPIPTDTFVPLAAPTDDSTNEQEALDRVISLLDAEDRNASNDRLSLIVDRKAFALVPDENGNYTLEAEFDNGEVARMIVPGAALGLTDEDGLIITITQSALADAETPEVRHNAELVTQYIYDIRAFLSDGTEVTQFAVPIEIVIVVPEPLQGKTGLGVYFINTDSNMWERVPDVAFTEFEATFEVDHLTVFAIWAAANEPATMEFAATDDDSESEVLTDVDNSQLSTCGSYLFGFLPLCWPWPLLYVLLFVVAVGYSLYRVRSN